MYFDKLSEALLEMVISSVGFKRAHTRTLGNMMPLLPDSSCPSTTPSQGVMYSTGSLTKSITDSSAYFVLIA